MRKKNVRLKTESGGRIGSVQIYNSQQRKGGCKSPCPGAAQMPRSLVGTKTPVMSQWRTRNHAAVVAAEDIIRIESNLNGEA